MRSLVWTVVFAAAVVAACTSTQDAVAPRRFRPRLTTVDMGTAALGSKAQLIKGWGLVPGLGPTPFGNNSFGPAAEKDLDTMGITFIRDQLVPGMYDSGMTLDSMVLNSDSMSAYETKWSAFTALGMKYILSVWSPPGAFKDSPGVKGGTLDTSYAKYSAYVAYLTKVMEGLNTSTPGAPMMLSVQNEPDVKDTGYASTPYQPGFWETIIDDTRGSLNYVHLTNVGTFGPELSTLTLTNEFLGGSNYSTIDSGYFESTAIGAYAFHTYGDDSFPQINSNIISAYPKDVWVTEYSKPNLQGSSEVGRAIDLASALGGNLEMIPTNYWAWWLGIAYADTDLFPGALILSRSSHHDSLEVTSMYYVLKKIWKNVIPESWYLKPISTSSDANLRYNLSSQQTASQARIDFYGFQSSDSTHTVVVISNWTNDDKEITVTGFPKTYKVQHGYVSDSASSAAELIPQDSSTCWVPSGASSAQTVLYAPHRGVLVAVMH